MPSPGIIIYVTLKNPELWEEVEWACIWVLWAYGPHGTFWQEAMQYLAAKVEHIWCWFNTNVCFPPYKHQQNTMWCCLMPSCFTSAVPMATKKVPLSPCPSPSSCHQFRWFSMPELEGTQGEWVLGHTDTHLNSLMSLAQNFFISTNQTICGFFLPFFLVTICSLAPGGGSWLDPTNSYKTMTPATGGQFEKDFWQPQSYDTSTPTHGWPIDHSFHRRFVHYIAGCYCGEPYM